jgi:hypothetical protein
MSREDLISEESDALVLCLFSPKIRSLDFGGDVRRTEGAEGVGFAFCLGMMIFEKLPSLQRTRKFIFTAYTANECRPSWD